MLAIAALTTTALACLWPTDASDLQDPAVLVSPQAPVTTGLGLSADTYLRQGEPNQNFGTELILRVRPTGRNRALLQVDPAALAAAVGGGPVTAARLDLTITHNADNWGASGRDIALHRLTVPWSELGATWNCGVDTVPGNPQAECAPGTAWEMGTAGPNPWEPTPTATATITNGLTGVVTFDVTADVAAWLGGVLNAGWILKRTDEGPSGAVEFGARESVSPPVLVLTLMADTARPPVPTNVSFDSDTTISFVSPTDPSAAYYRNVFEIIFDDTTSGPAVFTFLSRYQAEIIAGIVFDVGYVIRVPDPGPTEAAVDSLLVKMRAEPGVHIVLPIAFRGGVDLRARHPVDGPLVTRAAWLASPTEGTRAWRAIRAPLAWGCETGTYGTQPRVGVIDNAMTSHPDLPTNANVNLPTAPFTVNNLSLSHGMGTTGIVAAVGDNSIGIAGMVWQSELHLYALANGTNAARNPLRRFDEILRLAQQDGVRLLTSSISFGAVRPVDHALALMRVDSVLTAFFSANPLTLLVQAAVNMDSTFADTASFQGITAGQVLIDQTLARLLARFGNNFLLVGGTDSVGNRRRATVVAGDTIDGSVFVPGVVQIMAPSGDVLSLADLVEGSPYRLYTGNSFAAPFVAGVAAQLLAFDPTLTPGEIKDYIIRGAQEPKGLDSTGNPIPVTDVDGLGVYQLDAYGALTLAARERPGTPICGFPVFARDDAVFQVRAPGDTQTIPVPVPSGTFLSNVSVAQGGRLLAVTRLTGGDAVVQFTHTGQAVGSPLPLTRRQFLERDTLDWSLFDSNSDSWLILRRGNGTTDSLNAAALTFPTPTGTRFTAEVEGSPAGDWMAVRTLDAAGGTVTHRWDLLDFVQRVPQPVATIVRSLPLPFNCLDCDGIFVPERIAGWTHDGQQVLFAFPRADRVSGSLVALRTRVQRVPVVNGAPSLPGPTDVVEQVIAKRPRFTADDAVLIWNELDLSSTCYRATRTASSPTQLLGVEVVDIAECDLGDAGPTIFNAPPPAVTAGGTPAPPEARRVRPARR